MVDSDVPVEAKLSLQELFSRYNWALDTCNAAGVADLFVENGVFDGSARSWRGREEIESMVLGAREGDGELRSQHWTTNSVYRMEGERCRILSATMAPATHDQRFEMTFIASYVDTCVKRHGTWLFEERRFLLWDGQGSSAEDFVKGGFDRSPDNANRQDG